MIHQTARYALISSLIARVAGEDVIFYSIVFSDHAVDT